MEPFKEIEGAMLEGISTSESSYIGKNSKDKPLTTHGYSLVFDLGKLVIENPFYVVSEKHENIEPGQLVGLKAVSAYSNEEEIRIIFESGAYISVSMKDRDFAGPEAASYSPKQGNIIVFN